MKLGLRQYGSDHIEPVIIDVAERRQIGHGHDQEKGDVAALFSSTRLLLRCGLSGLFGHRLLLLIHTGRRTGLRRQTVLEVVEYRKDGPEVVVVNGFGPNSDWVRNIEANPGEEVTVGSRHFVASHRFLGEEEAMKVIQGYERRNRFISPIVRAGLSCILGWRYHGSDEDRRRLVHQLPLIAFRPASSNANEATKNVAQDDIEMSVSKP